MKLRSSLLGLAIVALAAFSFSPFAVAQEKKEAPRMLSHDVFFELNDDSAAAKKDLVAGCKQYLSKHPGVVWFAAGARVVEHERDVNDAGFDVALHVVFKDKASHDLYQKAADHLTFIEKYKDNWKSVRVFDSWIEAQSHGEME